MNLFDLAQETGVIRAGIDGAPRQEEKRCGENGAAFYPNNRINPHQDGKEVVKADDN